MPSLFFIYTAFVCVCVCVCVCVYMYPIPSTSLGLLPLSSLSLSPSFPYTRSKKKPVYRIYVKEKSSNLYKKKFKATFIWYKKPIFNGLSILSLPGYWQNIFISSTIIKSEPHLVMPKLASLFPFSALSLSFFRKRFSAPRKPVWRPLS